MYYRKKPVVIEARQLPKFRQETAREELLSIAEWCDADKVQNDESWLRIDTLEGTMVAQPGDYVIKGVKGEFYPCKPDIFEATYELVDGPAGN